MLNRVQLSSLRSRTFGASRWLLAPERRWLLLLAVAVAAFGTFLEISEDLIEDRELLAYDQRALAAFRAVRTPFLTMQAVDITALGSVTLLFLAAFVAGIPLLRMRDYRGVLQLITTMLGVTLWTFLTKHWFARERPDIAHRLLEVQGYSFPSGHSSGSAALYLTLAMVYMPHLRRLSSRVLLFSSACTLALAIGLSRCYLGVHYPSDVASGLSFGGGWALLLAAAFEWRKRPAEAG
jgi:undecaprenyl-diphosphatase